MENKKTMTQPSLPQYLTELFVPCGARYSHVCTLRDFLWRFDVPLSKQRQFWRFIKANEKHNTQNAQMHQVSPHACDVEAWASTHVIQTNDAGDRISAADVAAAFERDTGVSISSRALGDVLKHVLRWQRLKSHGRMLYTGVRLMSRNNLAKTGIDLE
jgi:hypothetical protein